MVPTLVTIVLTYGLSLSCPNGQHIPILVMDIHLIHYIGSDHFSLVGYHFIAFHLKKETLKLSNYLNKSENDQGEFGEIYIHSRNVNPLKYVNS